MATSSSGPTLHSHQRSLGVVISVCLGFFLQCKSLFSEWCLLSTNLGVSAVSHSSSKWDILSGTGKRSDIYIFIYNRRCTDWQVCLDEQESCTKWCFVEFAFYFPAGFPSSLKDPSSIGRKTDWVDLRPSKRPSEMLLWSDASADNGTRKSTRVPTQELFPIVLDGTEPNSESHRLTSKSGDRVALLL